MKKFINVSTKGLCTINVTSDNVLWDHVVLLDLVDGLALPELFTLFRKPLPVCAPSCPCEEPSSCSSGTLGASLSHQEVDLLELESHPIDSSHVDSFLLSLWCLMSSRRSGSTCQ